MSSYLGPGGDEFFCLLNNVLQTNFYFTCLKPDPMTKNCTTYLGAENNENHLELMSVFGDAFHLQGKLGVTVGILIEGSIVRDLCLKIVCYQIKFF